MKLNIGAGDTVIEGYEAIDRKFGKEAYPLDVPDESCEEIRASHVLEHFGVKELYDVVANWVAKLKPGGVLKVAVPNFKWVAHHYLNNGVDKRMLRNIAMGGQLDENDFHRSAFDFEMLHTVLRGVGLHSIKPWKDDVFDCSSTDCSLNLQGTKRMNEPFPYKLHAVMSCPRLAFTENMFCAAQVIVARGIELTKTTGAWWHHCLERVAEGVLDKCDYIITLDYDTVFTEQQFQDMARLIMLYPEIDALAPWQAKREHSEMLAWIDDGNGRQRHSLTVGELFEDTTPAKTASFALTWIKTSALKQLEHPWFHEQPDAEGKWGDGRYDPDIYFWKKFRDAGFKLHMANHVGVGHLQQMVTWVGRDLKPVHQYLTEFQENGLPAGVIK